jgi:hypothetical protein
MTFLNYNTAVILTTLAILIVLPVNSFTISRLRAAILIYVVVSHPILNKAVLHSLMASPNPDAIRFKPSPLHSKILEDAGVSHCQLSL